MNDPRCGHPWIRHIPTADGYLCRLCHCKRTHPPKETR